jgi:hypothetical protein
VGSDAADPGIEVRHLEDILALKVDSEDIADPALVRKKIKALRVRRPLRVDVFCVGEASRAADLAGIWVHQGELIVSGTQDGKVGRKPVSDKSNVTAIRGPGRMNVGESVIGHLFQVLGVQVVNKEVRDTAIQRGKGDALAVGRPGRIEDFSKAGKGDICFSLFLGNVEDREHRTPLANGAKDVSFSFRVPSARGADELDAFKVGVHGCLSEFSEDLAGFSVGLVELDRKQIPRRKEDKAFSVGAKRRRNIVGSFFASSDKDSAGFVYDLSEAW